MKLFLFLQKALICCKWVLFQYNSSLFALFGFSINCCRCLYLFIYLFFFHAFIPLYAVFTQKKRGNAVEPCHRKNHVKNPAARTSHVASCEISFVHKNYLMTFFFSTQRLPALQATVTDRDAKHSNAGCCVVLTGGGDKKRKEDLQRETQPPTLGGWPSAQ